MKTYPKIYIKTESKSINDIIFELKEHYNIGQIENLDTSVNWYYSSNKTETIILSTNYNHSWCQIEFEFNYSIYFYDEFLRRLSAKFNTKILLGYYQSKRGNGRIAKFKNGSLDLSVNQEYNNIDGVYLTDNFGVSEKLKREFNIPKLGKICTVINCNIINHFFKNNGLPANNFKKQLEEEYLHIEKIII